MKIFSFIQNRFNRVAQGTNQNQQVYHTKPDASSPLSPLQKDTVSFSKVDKSQFEGIDLNVVEKFDAPLKKFKSKDDLQTWAGEEAKKIANKDFGGKYETTKIARKCRLGSWSNHLLKDDAYDKTTALLVLNSITKGLKPNNDNIPPALNEVVLDNCISKIDENIKANKKYKFDFNEMYAEELNEFCQDYPSTDDTATKWVRIPSRKHDRENFQDNMKRLMKISSDYWDTKDSSGALDLTNYDYHVFLENGKAKVGVVVDNGNIVNLYGERSNHANLHPYIDEIKNHIQDDRLKLTSDTEIDIRSLERAKKEADEVE